jgi:phage tail sheath protein FI
MTVAIENTPPGVSAIINAGQTSRPVERQPSSTAFLVGYAPWGPTNQPITVTSFSDYARKFGPLHANSRLADAVKVFFDFYGGRQAIVSRVVGATPVKDTLTLVDSVDEDTLRVDAKYPSTDVDIKVTVATGTAANSKKFTFASVYLGVTEVFDNVTLDADSLLFVNERSKLVDLVDLDSVTAAPGNLPDNLVATALATGTDDFAGLDQTEYVAGLAAFADSNLGTGQVAVPGITHSTVYAALKTHAELYQRLAILDAALGNDVAEMLAVDTSAYRSSHVALYYPWQQMLDMAGSGAKKFYPPSIFALGACAKVDRTVGVHKAPANIPAYGVIDVERNTDGTPMFSDNARALLSEKQINVIAPIQNEGIKIYDAKVLYPTGETRVRTLHERRVLNLLFYSLKLGLSWAVFEPVSGKLFRSLKSSASNFCRNLWNAGAFYGKTEADAFLVTCDESNNPPESLELGIVKIQVSVKISPAAERIIVNIDNVPLSQDLNILNGGEN